MRHTGFPSLRGAFYSDGQAREESCTHINIGFHWRGKWQDPYIEFPSVVFLINAHSNTIVVDSSLITLPSVAYLSGFVSWILCGGQSDTAVQKEVFILLVSKRKRRPPTIKGIYIIIETRVKFVLLLYVCMYLFHTYLLPFDLIYHLAFGNRLLI